MNRVKEELWRLATRFRCRSNDNMDIAHELEEERKWTKAEVYRAKAEVYREVAEALDRLAEAVLKVC